MRGIELSGILSKIVVSKSLSQAKLFSLKNARFEFKKTWVRIFYSFGLIFNAMICPMCFAATRLVV